MNSFTLSARQSVAWKLLFDDTTLYVGYGGGAHSGKTYLACHYLNYMCRSYEGVVYGLARKELVTLKKTTLITLFKVLAETGQKSGVHFFYNQQLNLIRFDNGSLIYLIDTAFAPSDPEYARLGGFELTGCVIDESAETDRRAIEILFTRLGRAKNMEYGLTPKILECFNSSKTHVYDRYYLPYKENRETEHTKFVLAKPTDNPSANAKDYVDRILLTGDKVVIERLINANFDYENSPYDLFPDFDKICNIFTNSFIKGNGKRYMSADIAYLGADIFVIMIWDGFTVIKVISIDKIDETAIGNKLMQLAEEYSVPYSNIVYDADGLRKFTAESLKKLTAAKPFNNNSSALIDNQYRNLKAECAFKLKELVQSNELYIEDQEFRKQIIKDLENIRREPTEDEGKIALEKKSEHKRRTGTSPGYFDALIMRMIFELVKKGGWV